MSYLSGSCPFLSTTKEQLQPPPVPFLCSGDLEEVKKTIRHTKIDSSYHNPDPRPRCMWALFRFPRERNSSDAKPTDSPRGAQLLLQTVRAAGISSMRSNKNCCNDFKTRPINKKEIASIDKIPLYCKQYGFKVKYPNGKGICYHQEDKWAQRIYKQFNHPN
ncbi:unnamed protein product [Arctogadus glacialis]